MMKVTIEAAFADPLSAAVFFSHMERASRALAEQPAAAEVAAPAKPAALAKASKPAELPAPEPEPVSLPPSPMPVEPAGDELEDEPATPRRRGRPKGSTNKPKPTEAADAVDEPPLPLAAGSLARPQNAVAATPTDAKGNPVPPVAPKPLPAVEVPAASETPTALSYEQLRAIVAKWLGDRVIQGHEPMQVLAKYGVGQIGKLTPEQRIAFHADMLKLVKQGAA